MSDHEVWTDYEDHPVSRDDKWFCVTCGAEAPDPRHQCDAARLVAKYPQLAALIAGETRSERAKVAEEIAGELDKRAKDALMRAVEWREGTEGPSQEHLTGLAIGYDRGAFHARKIATEETP